MAGVTLTGLTELRKAVQQLEPAVTEALRKVAHDTAVRVMRRAKALVPVDTGVTRDSIDIEPHVAEKVYKVGVFANHPHIRAGARTAVLPNLDAWLEFGVSNRPAHPFLRPALDAENEQYIRDMQQAAEAAAVKVLG